MSAVRRRAKHPGDSPSEEGGPFRVDGESDVAVAVRRIVVWRRLEPGDVRTPGTEIAPESPHLEARVVEVGIAASLLERLEELSKKRAEVTGVASGWLARYEPAGVPFTLGGSMLVGIGLDYLPRSALLLAASFVVLGLALGVFTKTRSVKARLAVDRRWRDLPEREELAKIERTLAPRWERFATRLREETGFRADVRVGDIHEAERLVSIDLERLSYPETWRPDSAPGEVRYGWRYADGRVVEQRAELEDDVGASAPGGEDDADSDGADSDEADSEGAEGEGDDPPERDAEPGA